MTLILHRGPFVRAPSWAVAWVAAGHWLHHLACRIEDFERGIEDVFLLSVHYSFSIFAQKAYVSLCLYMFVHLLILLVESIQYYQRKFRNLTSDYTESCR